MRKLYMFNFVTLDGFFEGTRKWDLSWHNVDDEFQEFAIGQLDAQTGRGAAAVAGRTLWA